MKLRLDIEILTFSAGEGGLASMTDKFSSDWRIGFSRFSASSLSNCTNSDFSLCSYNIKIWEIKQKKKVKIILWQLSSGNFSIKHEQIEQAIQRFQRFCHDLKYPQLVQNAVTASLAFCTPPPTGVRKNCKEL